LQGLEEIQPHPLFEVVPGEVEAWERGEGQQAISS